MTHPVDFRYDLALDHAVQTILEKQSRRVLMQLADGLKPYARRIQDHLEAHTKATILVWGGSCFGSCDIPLEAKTLGVDLVLQWGHSMDSPESLD